MNRAPARRALALVIGLAMTARLAYVLAFVDFERGNYWEYGEIARNLRAGNGYALFHGPFDSQSFRFDPSARPVPSAYMPPGYVAFLYPFICLDNVRLQTLLLLFVQAIIGSAVVGLVYRFTQQHIHPPSALTAAIVAALLPEFVYAAGSFTPTVMYHLFILLFLLGLYRVRDSLVDLRQIIILALVALALFSIRAEFAGMIVFAGAWLWKQAGWRRAMLFTILILVGYAPWALRNAAVFGRPVLLTTSGGLNLFRGHNPLGRTDWSDDSLSVRLAGVPLDSAYEPTADGIYRERVRELVAAHPWSEPGMMLKKALELWIFDWDEGRALNVFYLGPWLILLSAAAVGFWRAGPLARHAPILAVLGYTTFLAAIFFVLPRYQAMMKVVIVPFAAVGLVDMGTRFVDFLRQKS
jgi:hypothetical protein